MVWNCIVTRNEVLKYSVNQNQDSVKNLTGFWRKSGNAGGWGFDPLWKLRCLLDGYYWLERESIVSADNRYSLWLCGVMVSVPDCLSGGKGSIPFIVALMRTWCNGSTRALGAWGAVRIWRFQSRDIIKWKIAGPITRRLPVQIRFPLLKE